MAEKLKSLPKVSSISGPYKGITELELEELLDEAPKSGGEVVFVGRFCELVVLCVGKVLEYEEVGPNLARLKIKGTYASCSINSNLIMWKGK